MQNVEMNDSRRAARRAHAAGSFTTLALLSFLFAAPVAAQQLPRRTVPTPIDFATGDDDNLYSLGRSQEDIHEWELGLADLAAGEVKAAVERLHKLLQRESGGVVPVAAGRFLGLRLAVVTTMANMPPAAVLAYETLVRREAGNLAGREPVDLQTDQLELLATRFPTSSLGRRARLRLGDLALTAGRGIEAMEHFRQAMDATPIGSAEERVVADRMTCAAVLMDPASARADLAAKRLPPEGASVLSVLPASADPTGYPVLGGGGDGRRPMTDAAGKPRTTTNEEVAATGFDYADSSRYAMLPVGDLDGIFVNTGSEVIAFDPLRAALAWISITPNDAADRGEQVNKDMVLAAACSGDVVVAPLQVPEKSANVDFQGAFRVISKIPQRRLFAFSRRTGLQVWSHFDDLDGQRTRRFRGHDACGPATIVGDTVFAPVQDRSGAIAFSVAAYDLATGQTKWRRLVCSSQQDVNMFGNARSEFAASPLTVANGIVYGSSNLGVTFAIESGTGRIRWITSYPVVRMPRAMLQHQAERPVYFANNAPVVIDGVVLLTPLDSPFAIGIETETGAIAWRVPADATIDGVDNRVRWIAGALDDEFVLAGRGAVAVKAQPDVSGAATMRQLVRPEALRARGDDEVTGRPAITAEHVWFPRNGRILGFDRAGNPVDPARRVEDSDLQPGNLLFVDGIIVSLRQRSLAVLLDSAALEERVGARVAASPDDPAAILRLAKLRRALTGAKATAKDSANLRALLERGVAACTARGLPPTHPTRQALQRTLFDQAHDDANAALERNDPKAGELLVAARAAAPDAKLFVAVQAKVLERAAGDPERSRVELDRLLAEAPDATMPANGLPVRVHVAWQRALLPTSDPAAAVAAWQDLLENHGDQILPPGRAAAIAEAAIARLVAEHGEGIYRDVAARAEATLQAAGNDAGALQEVSRRFPNAPAAQLARMRVLDLSVQRGDLALACRVLAQGGPTGLVSPRILRRVLVAAEKRGNHALARSIADRLRPHRDEPSDWPDDRGATFGAVADTIGRPPEAPTAVLPGLPLEEIGRLPVRVTGAEAHHLLPVVVADGFAAAVDRPLFATLERELVAIDVAAAGGPKTLYSATIEFAPHVVACGTTIVVPDFDRIFAVEHRTGELLWDLRQQLGEVSDGMLFEDLGVQAGVLHVFAFSQANEHPGGELIGIEPLTGAVVFRRPMAAADGNLVPKPTATGLLSLASLPGGGLEIRRIDPLTGGVAATVRVDDAALRSGKGAPAIDNLAQRVSATGDLVILPLDANQPDETPRVVAIGPDGAVAWQWIGRPGARLVAPTRGDRVVVAESSDRGGRLVLLSATDGSALREAELGPDAKILNWEVSWLFNPAPATLAVSDRADPTSRRRRFVAFGVEQEMAIEVPLANDDGDVERQPIFGDDFVTFAVRSNGRQPLRLYSMRLGDRSGALPNGQKFRRIELQRPHGLAAFGAYTVLSSAECLLVLGPNPR